MTVQMQDIQYSSQQRKQIQTMLPVGLCINIVAGLLTAVSTNNRAIPEVWRKIRDRHVSELW